MHKLKCCYKNSIYYYFWFFKYLNVYFHQTRGRWKSDFKKCNIRAITGFFSVCFAGLLELGLQTFKEQAAESQTVQTAHSLVCTQILCPLHYWICKSEQWQKISFVNLPPPASPHSAQSSLHRFFAATQNKVQTSCFTAIPIPGCVFG